MFTAFALKDDKLDADLKEEINKNSYSLPIPKTGLPTSLVNLKVSDKSFHGKSSRSFYGCIECKQRKKKCDERKPSCSSCIKRNVPCNYNETVFKRKPNPSYPRRKVKAKISCRYNDSDLDVNLLNHDQQLEQNSLPEIWNPVDSNIDFTVVQEQEDDVIDKFMESILIDFPYSQPNDIVEKKPIIDTSRALREENLIVAMDESQIMQNVDTGNEDKLLLRFISNVKRNLQDLSDEELSKYVSSGNDDFSLFKDILYNFLHYNFEKFSNLDDLDKFYLSSFIVTCSDFYSFSSAHEENYCNLYLEIASRDEGLLQSLITWGAGFLSYTNGGKRQSASKKSLDIYAENMSNFVTRKQKEGIIDKRLADDIVTTLISYSHVCLLLGNTKEWMEYHLLLEKFIQTHFGSLTNYVETMKDSNPKLTKVITSNIFSHAVLSITNYPLCFTASDFTNALINSRFIRYDEFDSIMGYCAGIYIQVAKFKELALHGKITNELFDQFDERLVEEKPNSNIYTDNDGFSEHDLELHLTFFEVQQISARLYLRQLSKRLDPNDEDVVDMLLNILSSMQILLKTAFEFHLGFPLLMSALVINEPRHDRILKNIVAHLRSHNQTGNILRACMVIDEISLMEMQEPGTERVQLYEKTIERLSWDICFCC